MITVAPRAVAATAMALALSISVALLRTAHAQVVGPPTHTELDDAIREGQRFARNLQGSATPAPRNRTGVRQIEAARIDGVNQKQLTAEGSVVLSQDSTILSADRLTYDKTTDTAQATGNIRLDRSGDIVTGERLELKIDADTGFVEKPTYFFSRNPSRPTQRFEAHGNATRLLFEGENRERLFDATYTTCKPSDDQWQLKLRELALDRNSNVGTAYNGRIEFQGVPILYLPYMTFPLDNERKSGFLPPSFGSSTKGGAEFAIPYYWNIARDTDATFTPKLFSKRGVQLGTELRYLRRTAVGHIDTEFLPSDRVVDRNRYLGAWRHFENLEPYLGKGWSTNINAVKVSDDNYFRDLSTRIANTAQTNLPRDAALNFQSDFGSMSIRTLSFQTLQDPLAPIVKPYRLQPQLTFNARPARVQGVELNTFGEFTDFAHPTLVNGQRLLLYPSIAYAITRPFGFLIPKVGYHVTHYRLGDNATGFEGGTRSLPIVSIDSGLAFERSLSWLGNSMTQTLEPRLFYLYVPFRNQTKLPLFSTSDTDFNFAQIFNENLFVGGDRISDAKQLTAAVTTRFIDNLTGIERLRAAIGQRYYFRNQQVTLAGSALDNVLGTAPGTARTATRSDLLFAVGGQLSDAWSLDSSFQYSTSSSQFQKSNITARYYGAGARLLNFSYRFTRDALKQLDVSTQWPIGQRAAGGGTGWTLLARANHSFQDRRLLEGLLGLEYNHGCWEFRLVAHRFTTATNQYSNSIQLQLELKGLSRLGINPFDTIKQNIAGYRRSDDR
ncbi:MAG: LPS-assembly protein LptD [Burkholderiales bacterium]